MDGPNGSGRSEPAGPRRKKRRYKLSAAGLAALRAKAAERRPWQHSTGPRTPEGKGVSKLNALRHGLRTAEAVRQRREVNQTLRLLRSLARD